MSMSNQIIELNDNVRHVMPRLSLMDIVQSDVQSIDRHLHESRGSMIDNWMHRRMKSNSVKVHRGTWTGNEEDLWSTDSFSEQRHWILRTMERRRRSLIPMIITVGSFLLSLPFNPDGSSSTSNGHLDLRWSVHRQNERVKCVEKHCVSRRFVRGQIWNGSLGYEDQWTNEQRIDDINPSDCRRWLESRSTRKIRRSQKNRRNSWSIQWNSIVEERWLDTKDSSRPWSDKSVERRRSEGSDGFNDQRRTSRGMNNSIGSVSLVGNDTSLVSSRLVSIDERKRRLRTRHFRRERWTNQRLEERRKEITSESLFRSEKKFPGRRMEPLMIKGQRSEWNQPEWRQSIGIDKRDILFEIHIWTFNTFVNRSIVSSLCRERSLDNCEEKKPFRSTPMKSDQQRKTDLLFVSHLESTKQLEDWLRSHREWH